MSDSTKRLRTLAGVAVVAAICGVVSHRLLGFESSWALAAAIWIWMSLAVTLVALRNRFGLPRGTWQRRFEPGAGPSLDPVVVELAADEVAAELVCGLLRSDGIRCAHRQTNLAAAAFGSGNATSGGPREVIVAAKDVERARALIEAQPVVHGGRKRGR